MVSPPATTKIAFSLTAKQSPVLVLAVGLAVALTIISALYHSRPPRHELASAVDDDSDEEEEEEEEERVAPNGLKASQNADDTEVTDEGVLEKEPEQQGSLKG